MQINWIDILRVIIAAALVALFIGLFCGCATTEKLSTVAINDSVRVQREVRVDTVYRDRWHTEYTKGDTVYISDSVWQYDYKYLTRTDSVYVRDSIPYPVEIVKEVRVRNWYDHVTAVGFWALLAVFAGVVIWKFAKWRFHSV